MISMDIETALFYGFVGLLIAVVSTLILLLIHSGFFTEINVQTCKPYIGEVRIAYKSARGPYKESGTLFTEVHSLLPQYRTIGVFYDDPRKKEPSHLRYIVGLILAENGEPVKEEDEATLKDWDYKFTTLPSINYAIQASFPFKSTLSIIIAVFRVYPVLNEYIEMRNLCVHPFIEVYDNEKGKIFFVGPLEKQNSFYVPEVLQTDEKPQADDDDDDDDDDQSSVSWDDSASYIKSYGFDSDSLPDDGPSISTNADQSISDGDKRLEMRTNKIKKSDKDATHNSEVLSNIPGTGNLNRSPVEEDSDNNTASSFEEIDEKDAPEIKKDATPSDQLKTEL